MSSIFPTSGGIKSVQNIVGSFGVSNIGATLQTAGIDISAVDTTKAVIIPTTIGHPASALSIVVSGFSFASSTQVYIHWTSTTSSTLNYGFQVVEFY